MYTHRQLWSAIDRLAARRGWSIGRLAVMAGLDATSLNPSKRLSLDAKPRWPSTETLSKLLSASDTSFSAFAELVDGSESTGTEKTVPPPTHGHEAGSHE